VADGHLPIIVISLFQKSSQPSEILAVDDVSRVTAD
jgi:hypothetical protein